MRVVCCPQSSSLAGAADCRCWWCQCRRMCALAIHPMSKWLVGMGRVRCDSERGHIIMLGFPSRGVRWLSVTWRRLGRQQVLLTWWASPCMGLPTPISRRLGLLSITKASHPVWMGRRGFGESLMGVGCVVSASVVSYSLYPKERRKTLS
jgi:hypothetical protein